MGWVTNDSKKYKGKKKINFFLYLIFQIKYKISLQFYIFLNNLTIIYKKKLNGLKKIQKTI